jgi:hypothetical protein
MPSRKEMDMGQNDACANFGIVEGQRLVCQFFGAIQEVDRLM